MDAMTELAVQTAICALRDALWSRLDADDADGVAAAEAHDALCALAELTTPDFEDAMLQRDAAARMAGLRLVEAHAAALAAVALDEASQRNVAPGATTDQQDEARTMARLATELGELAS